MAAILFILIILIMFLDLSKHDPMKSLQQLKKLNLVFIFSLGLIHIISYFNPNENNDSNDSLDAGHQIESEYDAGIDDLIINPPNENHYEVCYHISGKSMYKTEFLGPNSKWVCLRENREWKCKDENFIPDAGRPLHPSWIIPNIDHVWGKDYVWPPPCETVNEGNFTTFYVNKIDYECKCKNHKWYYTSESLFNAGEQCEDMKYLPDGWRWLDKEEASKWASGLPISR